MGRSDYKYAARLEARTTGLGSWVVATNLLGLGEHLEEDDIEDSARGEAWGRTLHTNAWFVLQEQNSWSNLQENKKAK